LQVNDPDIRILSKAEQKLFIDVLPFFHTGNMFAFALATGMRIGEICALEQSDIQYDAKYIDIIGHISIHALRHTYATTARNSGVAAQNVARLLGQLTV